MNRVKSFLEHYKVTTEYAYILLLIFIVDELKRIVKLLSIRNEL